MIVGRVLLIGELSCNAVVDATLYIKRSKRIVVFSQRDPNASY